MNSVQVYRGICAFVVSAFLVWPAVAPGVDTASSARKTAPDFSLEDSKGATIKLSDYKGKIVLLDFWATWCHGCKIEIPWYMEFQRKYKERGLVVIGVSMDEDGWKSVKPFLREHNLNYPIVVGSENLAHQYGVDSMPVTLLIDRDGQIAESHAGIVDKDSFEGDIKVLLEGAKSGVK
jgi:peroxiredoxin